MTFLTKQKLFMVMILCCSFCGCENSKEQGGGVKKLMGLSSLSVAGHQISPIYDPNISEFFLKVEPHEKQITLLATALEGIKIEVNDRTFLEKQTFDLRFGTNVFYIRADSNMEMRGYSLTITREQG